MYKHTCTQYSSYWINLLRKWPVKIACWCSDDECQNYCLEYQCMDRHRTAFVRRMNSGQAKLVHVLIVVHSFVDKNDVFGSEWQQVKSSYAQDSCKFTTTQYQFQYSTTKCSLLNILLYMYYMYMYHSKYLYQFYCMDRDSTTVCSIKKYITYMYVHCNFLLDSMEYTVGGGWEG